MGAPSQERSADILGRVRVTRCRLAAQNPAAEQKTSLLQTSDPLDLHRQLLPRGEFQINPPVFGERDGVQNADSAPRQIPCQYEAHLRPFLRAALSRIDRRRSMPPKVIPPGFPAGTIGGDVERQAGDLRIRRLIGCTGHGFTKHRRTRAEIRSKPSFFHARQFLKMRFDTADPRPNTCFTPRSKALPWNTLPRGSRLAPA